MKIFISFLAFLSFLCLTSCNNEVRQDTASEITQKIKQVNTLTLAEVSVNKIYTIRDNYDKDAEKESAKSISESLSRLAHWAEKKMKVGDRIGVYGLKRTYAATIDLSKLTERDITISNDSVTILLPEIEIKMLGNDFETKTYFEKSTLMRSEITEEERVNMKREASRMMDEDIAKNNDNMFAKTKTEAEEKARTFFTTILADWGFKSITVKTRIKTHNIL